jgi:hypothetical protein
MSITIFFKDAKQVEWAEGSDVRYGTFPLTQGANEKDALEVVDENAGVLGSVKLSEVIGYKKYLPSSA